LVPGPFIVAKDSSLASHPSDDELLLTKDEERPKHTSSTKSIRNAIIKPLSDYIILTFKAFPQNEKDTTHGHLPCPYTTC